MEGGPVSQAGDRTGDHPAVIILTPLDGNLSQIVESELLHPASSDPDPDQSEPPASLIDDGAGGGRPAEPPKRASYHRYPYDQAGRPFPRSKLVCVSRQTEGRQHAEQPSRQKEESQEPVSARTIMDDDTVIGPGYAHVTSVISADPGAGSGGDPRPQAVSDQAAPTGEADFALRMCDIGGLPSCRRRNAIWPR